MRKNQLTRPSVANVDVAIITVAQVPQPDFILIDKIIINCILQGISPIIVMNKSDINSKEFILRVKTEYCSCIKRILSVSALKRSKLGKLEKVLKNNTAVFCGQSAVGKTSLLNVVTGLNEKIGSLSEKVDRGKHTTRHTEIFKFKRNSFVVDTPGFSMLELEKVSSQELYGYYPEMIKLQSQCSFSNCTHTSEPNCAIKEAVDKKALSKGRYERYKLIFNEQAAKEKSKY